MYGFTCDFDISLAMFTQCAAAAPGKVTGKAADGIGLMRAIQTGFDLSATYSVNGLPATTWTDCTRFKVTITA